MMWVGMNIDAYILGDMTTMSPSTYPSPTLSKQEYSLIHTLRLSRHFVSLFTRSSPRVSSSIRRFFSISLSASAT